MKYADLDAGRPTDGLTRTERKKPTQLRREVRRLRMERGILAEAAAWCYRETESIPEGSYEKLAENSESDLHWTTVPCEGGHSTPSRAVMKPLGTRSWSGRDR